MTETIERLLDTAEIAIRQKGYNGVSFRELADDLGIKSASVHYYFRTKEDLGLALMERYSQRFFAALQERSEKVASPAEKLRVFCDVYREALVSSQAICLGGMLGAENCALPDRVAEQVAGFFKANIDWLAANLPQQWEEEKRVTVAGHAVATLQGLMLVSNSLSDHSLFDRSVERLCADLLTDRTQK